MSTNRAKSKPVIPRRSLRSNPPPKPGVTSGHETLTNPLTRSRNTRRTKPLDYGSDETETNESVETLPLVPAVPTPTVAAFSDESHEPEAPQTLDSLPLAPAKPRSAFIHPSELNVGLPHLPPEVEDEEGYIRVHKTELFRLRQIVNTIRPHLFELPNWEASLHNATLNLADFVKPHQGGPLTEQEIEAAYQNVDLAICKAGYYLGIKNKAGLQLDFGGKLKAGSTHNINKAFEWMHFAASNAEFIVTGNGTPPFQVQANRQRT